MKTFSATLVTHYLIKNGNVKNYFAGGSLIQLINHAQAPQVGVVKGRGEARAGPMGEAASPVGGRD